jgi:hypothetical protein
MVVLVEGALKSARRWRTERGGESGAVGIVDAMVSKRSEGGDADWTRVN